MARIEVDGVAKTFDEVWAVFLKQEAATESQKAFARRIFAVAWKMAMVDFLLAAKESERDQKEFESWLRAQDNLCTKMLMGQEISFIESLVNQITKPNRN